jgi:hypothetical protein
MPLTCRQRTLALLSHPVNRQLSAAVLATFSDAERADHDRRLRRFSARQWRRNLHWLDASGLALYFLQRLNALDVADAVPDSILSQLRQRYRDNQLRTAVLFEEFAALNTAFCEAGLGYLNLKGFTLFPDYCPDLSLRCQMDNDFLLERRDATRCREVLTGRGYRMIAAKPHVMEFKTDIACTPRISDLYKPRPEKSVEVHLCDRARPDLDPSLLERRRLIKIRKKKYPSLCTEDMFLSQAFHLFRHLRSEWTRISWLLEFRHFVITRRGDGAFWNAARERASQTPGAALAVGVAVRMAETAYGEFAPFELTGWSCSQVPVQGGRWIEYYGNDVLLADFPGSKLYLILERAIGTELNSSAIRRALFPRRAPAPIVAAPARGLRHWLPATSSRCSYFLFRLRFHITAGVRYFLASRRWKHLSSHSIEKDPCPPAECAVNTTD